MNWIIIIMTEFWVDVRFIYALKPDGQLKRGKLFRNYLWLSFLKMWSHVARVTEVQVLDFKVTVPDYHEFFHQYREIFIRHIYFFETTQSTPVILDCGGNMGMSMMYFKTLYPNAKITIFEPVEGNRTNLTRNIEQNSITDITIEPVALGREDGTIELRIDARDPGRGKVTTVSGVMKEGEEEHWESQSVPVRRLSSYVSGPVTCIKLDVEGAEGDVISELAESGKLNQVHFVVAEYHYNERIKGNDLGSILTRLRDAGLVPRIVMADDQVPGALIYRRSTYHSQLYAHRESNKEITA